MKIFIIALLLAIGYAQTGDLVLAEDLPRFHTPYRNGMYGYRKMPTGLLDSCTEPLHEGIPDWQGYYASYNEDTELWNWIHIEQCGDRIIFKSGGKIHDHYHADGTKENGLKDEVGRECICNPDKTPEDCVGKVDNKALWVDGDLHLYKPDDDVDILAAVWHMNDDGNLERYQSEEFDAGSDQERPWYARDEIPHNPDYTCDAFLDEAATLRSKSSGAKILTAFMVSALIIGILLGFYYLFMYKLNTQSFYEFKKEEVEI